MIFYILLVCACLALLIITLLAAALTHEKEKTAKLELMIRHPEHAAQIQEALDQQEKQFHSPWQPAWTLSGGGTPR